MFLYFLYYTPVLSAALSASERGDRYTLLVLFVYLISGLGVVGGICHLFKSPFGVAGRKKEFVCFDVLMEWIGLEWIGRIPRETTPTSS
jgi:hypothetical protein